MAHFLLVSGAIYSDQETALVLPLEILVTSEIRFWKKVSSEANYDYFKFYVDDIALGSWSGEEDWSEEVFEISSGHHLLKWEFAKDGYVDGGQDCAWLDFVVMPVISGLEPASLGVWGRQCSILNWNRVRKPPVPLEITNNGEADLFYEIMVNYPTYRDFGGPDGFG